MDTFQYNIVYIVANFIIYMMMIGSVQVNCRRRWNFWLTLLLEAVSFAGYAFINWSLPILGILRVVSGPLYVCIMAQIFHKESWLKKLILSAITIATASLAEIVFMSMMPREEAVTGELMQKHPIPVYSLYVFVFLVLTAIAVLLERMVIRRRKGVKMGKQWLIFLVFPLSQLISAYVFGSNYINLELEYNSVQLIVSIVVFILADVALIFSFRVSEKNAAIQARNEILEEQVGAQRQYYEHLAESYENVRKMRHDIDNHLFTIQALLNEGQVEEASSYAKTLTEMDNAVISFPGCANHVVSSFLLKKREDFEKTGAILDAEVSMPLEIRISNPDIICALGNILDNALEACKNSDTPQVTLKTAFNSPYLSIFCTNPVQEMPAAKKRRVPELERGIGFSILTDLAEKYDGQFKTELIDTGFETSLILKGDKNA